MVRGLSLSVAFFDAPWYGQRLPSVLQLLCRLSGIQRPQTLGTSWATLRVRVLETWHKGAQKATALCTYFQSGARPS